MSFRKGRPLPVKPKDFPEGTWFQFDKGGLGYDDTCLHSKQDGHVSCHIPHLLDTFRRASGEAHDDMPEARGEDAPVASRQGCRQHGQSYETSECRGSRPDDDITEHIQHARGSVSRTGMIPAPNMFDWLQRRNGEEQMRHHIDRQSQEALYGDVEMGGPSEQLTVLIWNAGKIDRDGVSRIGIAQDNMSLPFITGKHHVSLIQEATSKHAPAHWRSWGCVPMNGQKCMTDLDNEVGDN